MADAEPVQLSARVDPRILVLALGTFALATDAFVVAGVLRGIAQDLSLGIETAGQVVTAYAFTYAFGSPLLAAATARWSRERTIIMALTGFACADAVCAVATSFWMLTVARIAAASCAALYTPTAYAIAGALSSAKHRGAALAKVALGTTAAMVVGVPFGTWIGYALGWHAAFLLGSVLAALAALSLAATRIPPVPAAAPPRLVARFAPLARASVALSLLATLLWSTSTYAVYTYVSVIFGARLGQNDIALLLLAYGVGGLSGSQLGGRLIDRFGTTTPIIAAIAANAVNFAFMQLTGGTESSAAAALFMMAFCSWTALLAQQTRLLALEPDHGAVVMSLLVSAIYVGSAAGAALGGLLLAHVSTYAPPYAASMATALGLALFVLSNRRIKARLRG